MSDSLVTGIVKNYFDKSKYGFIKIDERLSKVFFHKEQVSYEPVEIGDVVKFDLCKGPKGYYAESVDYSGTRGDLSDSESDENLDQEVFLESDVTGTVKQFFDTRKYGFITSDTYNKVFFHKEQVSYEPVEIGDVVKFDLCKGPKGYYAESVEYSGTRGDLSDSESDENSDQEVFLESDVTGTVKQFFDTRKYGFITSDTYNKVFFHKEHVSYDDIEVGDVVKFDLYKGPKGYYAESVEYSGTRGDLSDSESDENLDQEVFLESDVTGTVKQFFDKRKYGFITNDTYNKVFFHDSKLLYEHVEVGDKVSFDLYKGPKGYFAENVDFHSDQSDSDASHFGHTSKCTNTNNDKGSTNTSDAEHMQHEGHREDCSSNKNGDGITTCECSRKSRETGNMLFKSTCEASGEAKLNGVKSALECYKKAYNSSRKEDDLVSAAKNIGTASWKLAKLKMKTCSHERKVIHDFFKDALKYFSTAYTRRSCKVSEWAEHLDKSIKECLDDIRSWIAPRSDDDQIAVLKEYVDYLPECVSKVKCYFHIATMYLRRGQVAFKQDEFKQCQGYMDECCTSLNEAKKRCTADVDQSFMLNITHLEKDIQDQKDILQKCLSKAREEQERRAQELREAQERQSAKDQLKGDLKKLESLQKLPIEKFVEEIYTHWPPKGGGGSKTTSASSSSSSSPSRGSKKKLLMRALSQYHPDKLDKEDHDIKWQVMSCEITKCLTQALDKVKT